MSMRHVITNRGLEPVRGGFVRHPELEPAVAMVGVEPGARVYGRGPLRVIVGKHPHTGRYHLSISCADREPTWQEIKDARYSLLRGRWMAQLLPPPDKYTNVHPYTFHLYEIDPPPEVS